MKFVKFAVETETLYQSERIVLPINQFDMKKIFTLAVALAAVIPAFAEPELKVDVINHDNCMAGVIETAEFPSGAGYTAYGTDNSWDDQFYILSKGYIGTVKSPGLIKKVFGKALDASGVSLSIYVSNTPMDSFDAIVAGTLVGDVVSDSEVTIPDEYKYVAVVANSNNYSLDYSQISFTWETNGVGVDAIEAASGEAEYYSLQGVRVDNPENGMFIRVQNGKGSKVFVK